MFWSDKKLFIGVYVDDLIFVSNNKALIKKVKNLLKEEFKMKDMGEIKSCLGFRITRDRINGKLQIDQEEYLRNVLERFNMSACNPVSTPVDLNVKLDKSLIPSTDEEKRKMNAVPYQEAIGSLLYAAQCTRPDISFVLNFLSRFNGNPGVQHWNTVKRILRYIKGTLSHKLEYRQSSSNDLVGYRDSDWASDTSDRKSTTGYIFFKGDAAISWNTRKQQTVAHQVMT
ncbi:Reverse transcriptase (RNA-dependent DNA polymerase) [Popillia japonica]|uniref:Reverse transcriptase (RNA-dependent DNA polymerase) n=1 Tax=Popillia japonica TaxID=7064 RepID=A0AAW1I8S0_POPJA